MLALPTLVSIIVPAFNAGSQIRRCVESILRQTHREIEVIVVNDCSADDTLAILDDLAVSDPRIKVIRLFENVGVHAARARGVRESGGEYLAFVDADDWIDPKMIAALLNEATTFPGADIVVCGAVLANGIGQCGRHKVRFRRRKAIDYRLLERFCQLEFGSGVLWNKLYRADLIRPFALKRLERRVDASEDYIVNIGCFANAHRVITLPETYYYYYENPESASRAAPTAMGFSRTLRAYVACLETYADSLRGEFSLISSLYARQLNHACYRVGSLMDFKLMSGELQETLERLARIYPEGAYALVHSFDVEQHNKLKSSIHDFRQVRQTILSLTGM
jgi:glycosyltransferase involved in cell wall biosynthesis